MYITLNWCLFGFSTSLEGDNSSVTRMEICVTASPTLLS